MAAGAIKLGSAASALLFMALLAVPAREARAADPLPTSPTPPALASLLSLSLAQDFGLHAGEDVCSKQSQIDNEFACFRTSGTQYHGTPLSGQGGQVGATPRPATTRLFVGFDRIFGENFTLGLRLGYVLRGGGPRQSGVRAPSFLPFHGEARTGYTFGADPFREAGLRWSLFAGGGIAEVDTEYRVTVREDTSKRPPVSQIDNPDVQTLMAYKKTGTGFFGGGASVTYAIRPAFGFSVGLRLMQMFPSSGTILSPELGGFIGF